MTKIYRKGAIGALTDEYEKALNELKSVLVKINSDDFKKITDLKSIKDLQSVRNIILHVVRSGFIYANYIRKRFDNPIIITEIKIETIEDGIQNINEMFQYTVDTFKDKWQLTDDDLMNTIIKTSWTTYDLEAIIEHAIVHILRHRLQIEKMIVDMKLLKL